MASPEESAETGAKKILVLEHDEDIAYLMQVVLADAGYQVERRAVSGNIIEQVHQLRPDLLLLNLLPHLDPYELLDILRADPVAARLPVLAVAASERMVQASLASYNVRATLTKPFDLGELLAKAAEALGQPPFHSTIPFDEEPNGFLGRAERILAFRSRDALFRWVQRLRGQMPWRVRDDLGLSNVINSVPVLVEVLTASLRYGGPEELLARHPEVTERVGEHARVRRQQGFALADLIREYSILRDELLATLWRNLPEQVHRDDAESLARSFNATLDRIIEVTVLAYLNKGSGDDSGA